MDREDLLNDFMASLIAATQQRRRPTAAAAGGEPTNLLGELARRALAADVHVDPFAGPQLRAGQAGAGVTILPEEPDKTFSALMATGSMLTELGNLGSSIADIVKTVRERRKKKEGGEKKQRQEQVQTYGPF